MHGGPCQTTLRIYTLLFIICFKVNKYERYEEVFLIIRPHFFVVSKRKHSMSKLKTEHSE